MGGVLLNKVKLITDSTCDLPDYIINKYDIEVLPLLVNFGEESYRDGIDINLHTLLMRISEGDVFPTTSQVNPQRFIDCYKKYLDEGYKILSIHFSSKMSGTYASALIAKETLETDDIIVIDSKNVTSGLGLLVLKAAKLKEEGIEIEEIEKRIREAIPHVKSVLAFPTLDNLIKGGRLSKTSGTIANILGIKPILSISNGELAVIDKVRGSKKAIRYVVDKFYQLNPNKDEVCILLHVENQDMLDSVRVALVEKNTEFIECQVGCVVGVHAGPGACGLFFIEEY